MTNYSLFSTLPSLYRWVACLGLIATGTLLSLALQLSPAQAQTNATDSAESEEEATQNLKKRIERVVQDNQAEIDQVIEDLSSEPRGFIGQVQRLSEEAITLNNPKGTQIVAVDETVDLTKAGDPIELDDIAVDDWALVMGMQQGDTFEPISISISSSSLRPKDYTVMLGSISQLSSRTVSIIPRTEQAEATNQSLEFRLDTSTSYQDLEGTALNEADLAEDVQVLLVGYVEEDGDRFATAIKALTIIEELNAEPSNTTETE